jgi:dGTPase
MNELRDFMFERVYMAPAQVVHQQGAVQVIRGLVEHHLAHLDELPPTFRETDDEPIVRVVDYVAGMTDRFALATYERLIGPPPIAQSAYN